MGTKIGLFPDSIETSIFSPDYLPTITTKEVGKATVTTEEVDKATVNPDEVDEATITTEEVAKATITTEEVDKHLMNHTVLVHYVVSQIEKFTPYLHEKKKIEIRI